MRDASPSPPLDRRQQRAEVIYRSTSLVVGDVRCPLFHSSWGLEEQSDQHTIVLVRTGLFTKTSGGDTLVADPNHVVFFTRHQPYRVSHPVAGGDTCTFLSLRTSDLLDTVRNHAPADAEREEAPFPFTSALTTPGTVLLHHALLAGLRCGHLTPLAAEDLAFELVDTLLRDAYHHFGRRRAGQPPAPRHQLGRVEAAKVLVEGNLQRPPSLPDLARALGCSPFHLSRTFHRASGLPLRRYLDRCRLRTGLERLAEGARDLTGLALDLGYADHSHFSNAFRREFGMPPSVFRRRARGALLRAARKNLQA